MSLYLISEWVELQSFFYFSELLTDFKSCSSSTYIACLPQDSVRVRYRTYPVCCRRLVIMAEESAVLAGRLCSVIHTLEERLYLV